MKKYTEMKIFIDTLVMDRMDADAQETGLNELLDLCCSQEIYYPTNDGSQKLIEDCEELLDAYQYETTLFGVDMTLMELERYNYDVLPLCARYQ